MECHFARLQEIVNFEFNLFLICLLTGVIRGIGKNSNTWNFV